VASLTAQSDNPATRPACPTDGKDHLVASAGGTQRRIRQIINVHGVLSVDFLVADQSLPGVEVQCQGERG
jgi:hypothetical protein